MTPTVGRIVHYVSRGSADKVFPSVCRAALVTEVGSSGPWLVGLAAINPTGFFFHSIADGGCLFDPGDPVADEQACNERVYPGGSWHWPPRIGG